MSTLRFRNTGRGVPRRFVRRRRMLRRRRRRRPMTTGKVKRIIDAELKLHDDSLVEVNAPNTTGLILHLSDIAQGDLNTERTGNWIKPVSLMGTLTVQGDPDGAAENAFLQYRVAIILWKENQTTDPISLLKVVQDVLRPFQQFNVESKGSFKVLWSRTGNIVNNVENSQFVKYHRFYLRPSMKILYDDDAFRKFHLFFLAYSNIPTAMFPPAISINTRLRYTDS